MRINIPDPSLVILCGPSACGKSTFARRHFKSIQIVSSDHCREMITDSSEHQRCSPDAFELFHAIIGKRLKWKRLTVADSTALGTDARADLRRLARTWQVPAVLIVFDVSEGTCLSRDSARKRQVREFVLRAQFDKLRDALLHLRYERYESVYILDEREIGKVQVHRLVAKPTERRANAAQARKRQV